MSRDVRLKFVCTGDGQHKERTLLTLDYHPATDNTPAFISDRPMYMTERGNLARANLSDNPASDGNHNHNTIMWNHYLRDTGLAGHTEEVRPTMRCPHCRPRQVYADETLVALGARYERFGGTCIVDVSTGAILHRQ